jgi:hypothetical protein
MSLPSSTPQANTILQWNKAWESLNADAVLSLLADEYVHTTLPSLGLEAGIPPPLPKEQFEQQVRLLVGLMFEEFQV